MHLSIRIILGLCCLGHLSLIGSPMAIWPQGRGKSKTNLKSFYNEERQVKQNTMSELVELEHTPRARPKGRACQ